MYDILLQLEKQFFQYAYLSDEAWLSAVLHDAFMECGKSGHCCGKKDTIKALLACKADRDIVIYNFQVALLDEHSWLVHYITISDDKTYYRTSIWVEDERLRLRFHQATRFYDDVDLIKC